MIITPEIAQELGLNPTQVIELNKMLAFINVKSINELPTILNPVDGNIVFEDSDGKVKKVPINTFYQLIGGLAHPISPSDTMPTVVGWYKPTEYSDDPGTDYPNLGNLKAVNGFDTLFYFDGTEWLDIVNKIDVHIEVNGEVSPDSILAVSGSAVYNSVFVKSDFTIIGSSGYLDFNPFIKLNTGLSSIGDEISYPDYSIVSKMPDSGGNTYIIENQTLEADAKYFVMYDINGAFISKINIDAVSKSYTTTSNTRFISFTLQSPGAANAPNIKLLLNGNNDESIILGNKANKMASYGRILKSIKPFLFLNKGFGSGGSFVDAADYAGAYMIPKFETKQVIIDGITPDNNTSKFFVKYDEYGVILSSIKITRIPFYIELESSCEFYSFTVKDASETSNDSIDNCSLYVIGNDPLNNYNGKMEGERGRSHGDSITWYDGQAFGSETQLAGIIAKGYQTYMRYYLGCLFENDGTSGRTMPEIWLNNIMPKSDYASFDFVTITSGANDHRKGTPLGAILPIGSTFNTGTFYGALQASIEHILSQNPTIRIVLITPVKGFFYENNTPDVPNLYKGEFEISRDFVNAMNEIGELYSSQVINVFDKTGINKLTIPQLIVDPAITPYSLHPSNIGYKNYGKVILNEIKI